MMRAARIPAPLAGLLMGAARGTVLAVFDRGAYLDLAGRVVALAPATADWGPLSIVLSDRAGLAPAAAGDPVLLDHGVLRIGPHTVVVADAAVWDPALPRPSEPSSARGGRALEQVTDELCARASPDSLVALLEPRARRLPEGRRPGAAERLTPLRRGLEAIGRFLGGRASAEHVRQVIAASVAGRGPGLTPSGDDLLMGVMHAITVWPHLAAPVGGAQAREALAAGALGRTTRISAAYLEAAAAGLAAQPWHRLVRSLDRSPTAIRDATAGILAIGHTSGADALTGFCWGWRLAARRAPS
jgi:hypothetical protein